MAAIIASKVSSNIVLITGANRGIGFGTARKLIQEHPGYHVIIGSRDASQGAKSAAELSSEGLSASSVQLDITDDDSIMTARDYVEREFGRLDVLINNAGISFEGREMEYSLRQRMAKTFDVNVFGTAAVTDAFLPLLEKSENPRIVFVSSMAGSLTQSTDFSDPWTKVPMLAYRSSKAAVNMVMAHFASQTVEKGFKVNAVCPGYIGTNLNNFQGTGTLDDGARIVVKMATLGKDGETGTFSTIDGLSPW
ncbi:hypothetical protein B7463_g8992, partial [Scytalidium lignicola]